MREFIVLTDKNPRTTTKQCLTDA